MLSLTQKIYLPRVEFVYDALEPYDGKQPGGEAGHPCQKEDGKCDETFPSGRVGQQRFHIDIRVRGLDETNSHEPLSTCS